MLTKVEKWSALVLVLVVLVLVSLYLCFGIFFPEVGVVQYTEDVPDKTRVSFEGEIISSKITSSGGHCLLNVSGVTVFVENGAEKIAYEKGDRVRVVGIAETYAGAREISVGANGYIEVI